MGHLAVRYGRACYPRAERQGSGSALAHFSESYRPQNAGKRPKRLRFQSLTMRGVNVVHGSRSASKTQASAGRLLVACAVTLVLAPIAAAGQVGRVTLRDGSSMSGDVEVHDDGSVTIQL